jgi:outer membrane protein TolC
MIPLRPKRFCEVLLVFCALVPAMAQQGASQPPLLSLNDAIQAAGANNRELKIASLEVEKSKWQVAAARTHRLPQFKTYIFGSGSLTDTAFLFRQGSLGTLNGNPNPSQNTRIPLSSGITGYALAQVAQPISQLYKIHLSIREQELSEDLNSEQYRGKRQSVLANVKQAYYAVLQTESSLEAANAAEKQYEETQRVAAQYLAQEAVLKSDTLDVDAKLAQSQYQIVELNNNLQSQKEQLNDLLGRDIETDFRTEQVPPIAAEESDLKLAQQTALSQRPEIREAAIQIKKADYDRKLAKADYIPDISAAFHYFTPLNTELLPTNVATAGVEMTWEPFEWGRRRDDVKQKTITVNQTEVQLQQVRSQILLDVNNRYRKLAQSRQALRAAQSVREAANEKLREVSDKFSKEAVLLRDVLQQQTAVANANHDYEEALLGFWTAKANFEKALGEE